MSQSALAELPGVKHERRELAPTHLLIIMDGNERWALEHGLARTVGYRRGAETAMEIIKIAASSGVTHLTLAGFVSRDINISRSEMRCLLSLLGTDLDGYVAELSREGIRLSVIGDRGILPNAAVASVERAERATKDNSGLHLAFALNYGGRRDIVQAARRLGSLVRDGSLHPDEIDQTVFASHLDTCFLPELDLMIRTSGEQRASDSLLWHAAYTEMLFVDKCWPDFTGKDLAGALLEFRRRDRRFGATG